MAPLSTLVDLHDVNGPVMVTRYNLYTRRARQRRDLSDAQLGRGDLDDRPDWPTESLPLSMKTEWTELTLMQIRAGNTAMYVFALAVVFVFLALAALYESWSLPLAVILVVPMCLLCSIVGVAIAHMAINIFVQIGLVVLVGLACKNAILIVEFAKQLHDEGQPLHEATREACRLRLRPIMMTSFRVHPGRRSRWSSPRELVPRCVRRWAPPCLAACSASRCSASSLRRCSSS